MNETCIKTNRTGKLWHAYDNPGEVLAFRGSGGNDIRLSVQTRQDATVAYLSTSEVKTLISGLIDLLVESAGYVQPQEEEDPEPEIPEWVNTYSPRLGSGYRVGDKVLDHGKAYICTSPCDGSLSPSGHGSVDQYHWKLVE